MPLRDYEKWLTRYDDPASALSWRLSLVQSWLHTVLDERPGPVRALSVCAGDGRDLIDVLARRADAERVAVRLLELHPGVAERARRRAAAAELADVEVRSCDAAATDSYIGAVPADLVLMVGMLGNMSHEDVLRTVATAPQFCSRGAVLIWSRGRDRDDINDQTRQAFTAAGFEEIDYQESDLPSLPAAGLLRYTGPAVTLQAGREMFTFWR